jgi:hypothetical protein
MREIGILIIDFSFPEEETSREQHLSPALYSHCSTLQPAAYVAETKYLS